MGDSSGFGPIPTIRLGWDKGGDDWAQAIIGDMKAKCVRAYGNYRMLITPKIVLKTKTVS